MPDSSPWPILKTYTGAHLRCVAMPVGGIGTGTVSLGGIGDLRDWELMNRPAKGLRPELDGGSFRGNAPMFVLHLRNAAGPIITRLLEGPIDPADYEGAHGARVLNHGLPRFRSATFETAYPLARVRLEDPAVPVAVALECFNPLIPGDAERSGLPIAVLRYVLHNPGAKAVQATVCGSVPNFIGVDGSKTHLDGSSCVISSGASRNRNAYRDDAGARGLLMRSDGVNPADPAWGTLALVTDAPAPAVTHRTSWAERTWGGALLDFWDDLEADGRLDERTQEKLEKPMGSLAVTVELPAGATRAITFLLGWHFPNRMTWTPAPESQAPSGSDANPNWIGNHYCTQFRDAWDVVSRLLPQLPALEAETVAFVSAFCASDLPAEVKEAALFNLSTLRSQTCFRTAEGHFFGFEGCNDRSGSCHGSCNHVWNYESATAFLFGDLARSMRDVEFAHATNAQGLMSMRVSLPLARATEYVHAAADGQLGCLVKLYREWRLCGDDAFLRGLWPHARRALAFCWIPGGWDADEDGIMEGCQHNTMDVEYYGPNPQMQGWYLAALRAGEVMARHLGDAAFAERCAALAARGRVWMESNLFNGEYYEHQIRPPADPSQVAKGLYHRPPSHDPILQLGPGCLVDQLVGPMLADLSGLGELLDPTQVRTTLASIWRHNRRTSLHGHFNHARSYVLGDESALLMATYPRGGRPDEPFPYCNEVMTGFEYTAAVGMLQAGLRDEGLACMRDIRSRYDGRKRNPFDEAECGHHYARAMASWGAVLALTGFDYAAADGRMAFAESETPATWFWSTGAAWGTLRQTPRGAAGELRVGGGQVRLARVDLGGRAVWSEKAARTFAAGESLTW